VFLVIFTINSCCSPKLPLPIRSLEYAQCFLWGGK